MTEKTDDGEAAPERRRDLELREIFNEAYDVLEPFFSPDNQWNGHTHEHLAYRALHERFPKLTGAQVLTLVTAAKRVFAVGGSKG
jgi:hypothetical protein